MSSCPEPFEKDDYIILNAVNTFYHVVCESKVAESVRGLGTYEEIYEGDWIFNSELH